MKFRFEIDVKDFFERGAEVNEDYVILDIEPSEFSEQERQILSALSERRSHGIMYVREQGLYEGSRKFLPGSGKSIVLKSLDITGVKNAIAETFADYRERRKKRTEERRKKVRENNEKLANLPLIPPKEVALYIYSSGSIGRLVHDQKYMDRNCIDKIFFKEFEIVNLDRYRPSAKKIYAYVSRVMEAKRKANEVVRKEAYESLENSKLYAEYVQKQNEAKQKQRREYNSLYLMLPEKRREQFEAGFLSKEVLEWEMSQQIPVYMGIEEEFFFDFSHIVTLSAPDLKLYELFIKFYKKYQNYGLKPAYHKQEKQFGASFNLELGGLRCSGFIPIQHVDPEDITEFRADDGEEEDY